MRETSQRQQFYSLTPHRILTVSTDPAFVRKCSLKTRIIKNRIDSVGGLEAGGAGDRGDQRWGGGREYWER